MKKLFEAKSEIPVIKKDANNPFFKSGYATLSAIIEATDPILAKHKLFITHALNDGRLVTALWDSETTGNQPVLTSIFTLPVNNDIQKIGSAITYAKRYNITAMLNLNIEDDDDGNAVKPQAPVKNTQAKKPEPISKECQQYIKYISEATTKKQLEDIGVALKDETKLTENDKSHLRELYKEKESKVK